MNYIVLSEWRKEVANVELDLDGEKDTFIVTNAHVQQVQFTDGNQALIIHGDRCVIHYRDGTVEESIMNGCPLQVALSGAAHLN